MEFLFEHIYWFMHRFLGVRRPLSAKEKTLAWMFSLYDFNYALSNIFMNVFLFKVSDNWEAVGAFNLVQFAVIPLAFWIGGHLSKKWGNLLSYQLGFFFNALVFATALIFRENTVVHPSFLGLLSGLGIGFYFLGEHSLTLAMTTEKTRDYFLSLTTFFSSVLCVLGPAMAGSLIALLRHAGGAGQDSLLGYYLVFAIALVLYVNLMFSSFQFKAKLIDKEFLFWRVLTLKRNGDWNGLMGAQFLWGLRNGVFWFLAGPLIYKVSHSAGVVGIYSMFTNLLAVLTSYGLSLWAKKQNRWRGLWISAWLVGASCVGLFFKVNYFSLLVYGVLNACGGTWFQIVFGAFSFNILEKSKEAKTRKMEYLAARELPLGLGRTLGLAGLLIGQAYFGEMGLRVALLIFGFAHMGIFLVLPKNKKAELAT